MTTAGGPPAAGTRDSSSSSGPVYTMLPSSSHADPPNGALAESAMAVTPPSPTRIFLRRPSAMNEIH